MKHKVPHASNAAKTVLRGDFMVINVQIFKRRKISNKQSKYTPPGTRKRTAQSQQNKASYKNQSGNK